jgi:uncharacterized coiled-coil protein SlyX
MSSKTTDKKSGKNFDDILASFSRNPLTDSEDSSNPRLTPSERISMIENAFKDILGREPDTRDLNYYKYSSLSQEEIRKELICSKEHQTLIEEGRESKKVKNSLNIANTRIKVLESEIQDQEKSFKELNSLLKEKNLHIKELRKELKSPFERRCHNEERVECSKITVEDEVDNDFFSKILTKFLSIFN